MFCALLPAELDAVRQSWFLGLKLIPGGVDIRSPLVLPVPSTCVTGTVQSAG